MEPLMSKSNVTPVVEFRCLRGSLGKHLLLSIDKAPLKLSYKLTQIDKGICVQFFDKGGDAPGLWRGHRKQVVEINVIEVLIPTPGPNGLD